MPITIESGLICNIRILLKNNFTDFSFLDMCELSSGLSIIENVDYIDGSITAMNSIDPTPNYQSVIEGSQTIIDIVDVTDDISCQWQMNTDSQWVDIVDESPFSGVSTFNLMIASVSADMNNALFRGMLSNSICSEGTKVSELVVSVSDLDERIMVNPIRVYPNPANGYLNCVFNENIQNAELKLININGKILIDQELKDIVSGQLFSMNIEGIEPGVYILNLLNNGILLSNIKVTII